MRKKGGIFCFSYFDIQLPPERDKEIGCCKSMKKILAFTDHLLLLGLKKSELNKPKYYCHPLGLYIRPVFGVQMLVTKSHKKTP